MFVRIRPSKHLKDLEIAASLVATASYSTLTAPAGRVFFKKNFVIIGDIVRQVSPIKLGDCDEEVSWIFDPAAVV